MNLRRRKRAFRRTRMSGASHARCRGERNRETHHSEKSFSLGEASLKLRNGKARRGKFRKGQCRKPFKAPSPRRRRKVLPEGDFARGGDITSEEEKGGRGECPSCKGGCSYLPQIRRRSRAKRLAGERRGRGERTIDLQTEAKDSILL